MEVAVVAGTGCPQGLIRGLQANVEMARTRDRFYWLLGRSDPDWRVKHQAALDMGHHNGDGHQHHCGGEAAENETEKTKARAIRHDTSLHPSCLIRRGRRQKVQSGGDELGPSATNL
jgi:hypothetical protein